MQYICISRYFVFGIFRLEHFLKGTEYGCLEQHGWHFAVPGNAMKHFQYVMIYLSRVLLELLQQQSQSFDDLHVGESLINKTLFRNKRNN